MQILPRMGKVHYFKATPLYNWIALGAVAGLGGVSSARATVLDMLD